MLKFKRRNYRWRVVLLTSLLILSLMVPTAAFAYYAYDYGNSEFSTSLDRLLYAGDAWNSLGFTYGSYFGSQFTKSTVLSNMPYGNGFYCFTHGNKGLITDNNGAYIYANEISSARSGDWKRLVFCDSCYSALDGTLAYGFGIQTGDGDLHCFIGWLGYTYDNSNYRDWCYWFWRFVKNHNTIYNSAQGATAMVPGVINWLYHGDPNWSY
jgi:hypothetical protein